MSKIIDCDPKRGFVAFPVALFDLDLSPGAFRTLAELCRMANAQGRCWPSLAQIGRRLGRSRASISSYIAELRAADVLRTEEQKMANGYNYRLRYTVTFWKEWRAGLGKEQRATSTADAAPTTVTTPKPERRIQQAERPLRTKNHIHKKQLGSSLTSQLVSDWANAIGKAPYPGFDQWPSVETIQRTALIAPAPPIAHQDISADIEKVFSVFHEKLGLTPSPDMTSAELSQHIKTKSVLNALIRKLEDDWQPHWKKPPNAYQIKRALDALPSVPDEATEQKLLNSYLRRWELYQRSLPSAALHSNVAA